MSLRPQSPGAESLLGVFFPVLDRGSVALIDYMGNDEEIERFARVSTTTDPGSDTRRFLRHLWRMGHKNPNERCELTFMVAAPIFIARQWMRSRMASVNEQSGRYGKLTAAFFEPAEWRAQDRSALLLAESDLERIAENRHAVAELYDDLLDYGVTRELARIDLPLSTYTTFGWKIDLWNLLEFLRQRCDDAAQKEIRAYAMVIAGIVKEAFPLTFEAWSDYSFGATKFSRQEMMALISEIDKSVRDVGGFDEMIESRAAGFGLSAAEAKLFVQKLYGPRECDFSLDGLERLTSEQAKERLTK